MPIEVKGTYTGMLGYSMKNEYFGTFSILNRRVETFDYEVICSDLANTSGVSSSIYQNFKDLFTGFSADINVKSISIPGANSLQEGQLRTAKFEVSVEARKTGQNLSTEYPELLTDYFQGIADTDINKYSAFWDNFSESIDFSKQADGSLESVHNLSMTLRSGATFSNTKSTTDMAKYIASGIFNKDKNITGFGVSVFKSGFKNYGDDSLCRNIYSETYDLAKNQFSFEKKQNIYSASGISYVYDLKHSMSVNEDGVFEVSEDMNIRGKKSFSEAELGYSELSSGSFGRCNQLFLGFGKQGSNSSIFDPLSPTALETHRVLNKPAIKIDASLKYSNKVGIGAEFTFEDDITVEREENSSIGINQSFNYRLLTPISGNMDFFFLTGFSQNIVQYLKSKKGDSRNTCLSYYQNSEFYNPSFLNGGLANISSTISTHKKKKDFTASYQYSNSPIYVTTLPLLGLSDVTTFKKVEYTINNKKPSDIFNEYKIINRPSQTSVLSYSFQSTEGTNNISLTAQVARRDGFNTLTSPRLPELEIRALYELARRKLLEMLIGVSPLNVFAYSYYLSDLTYSVNSLNVITFDATLTYTLKRKPS